MTDTRARVYSATGDDAQVLAAEEKRIKVVFYPAYGIGDTIFLQAGGPATTRSIPLFASAGAAPLVIEGQLAKQEWRAITGGGSPTAVVVEYFD